MLRSVYWQKIWPVTKELQLGMGKLGNDTIQSCEEQDAGGHPCSLLSAGKARKIGAKEFSAEIPEAEAVTPKIADSTTLEALKRGHHHHVRHRRCRCRHRCQQNNARPPTATEDQLLNYEPRWIHGGDYLPLVFYKDSLLLLSYLFYHPSSLPHYPNS